MIISEFNDHSVAQLLGSKHIVIPDIQRDFCWGVDSRHAERIDRVAAFVNGLIQLHFKGEKASLGYIYAYTDATDPNRIMVIDGQQRITSIYLLLGMLYRRCPEPWLRRLLISEYELLDDHEPRLAYQVRNEAMYFVSDLVTHFLLGREGRLSQIEQSNWYFESYNSDPTVRSILGALRSIDTVLNDMANNELFDMQYFASYIANNSSLYLCKLPSQLTGEAMFILLNTTGEPLTDGQFAKSIFYNATTDHKAFGEKWSQMRCWCWNFKKATDPDAECNPDEGIAQMLRLWAYWQKVRYTADVPKRLEKKHFDDLCVFFDAYSTLCEGLLHDNLTQAEKNKYGFSDIFALLPAINHIMRWGGNGVEIWYLLFNITRYTHPTLDDVAQAVHMVDEMPQASILSLCSLNGYSNILTDEVITVLKTIKGSGKRSDQVKALINRAQNHQLLDGRVSKVIEWCTNKNNGNLDIKRFEAYVDAIYGIWGEDINCNSDLDDVRRALITLRHHAYPVTTNDTHLSLCWNTHNWQNLMINAPGLIRQLLDRVLSGQGHYNDRLRKLAERFTDRTYPFAFMVNDPKVLENCRMRTFIRPCEPFIWMFITDKTAVHQWYIDQIPVCEQIEGFGSLYSCGSRCIYVDHSVLNAAIDIDYTPDSEYRFRIEVFSRDTAERGERQPCDLGKIISKLHLPMRLDRKKKRYYIDCPDARTTLARFYTIADAINAQLS